MLGVSYAFGEQKLYLTKAHTPVFSKKHGNKPGENYFPFAPAFSPRKMAEHLE
jgi:hypothetical protein